MAAVAIAGKEIPKKLATDSCFLLIAIYAILPTKGVLG